VDSRDASPLGEAIVVILIAHDHKLKNGHLTIVEEGSQQLDDAPSRHTRFLTVARASACIGTQLINLLHHLLSVKGKLFLSKSLLDRREASRAIEVINDLSMISLYSMEVFNALQAAALDTIGKLSIAFCHLGKVPSDGVATFAQQCIVYTNATCSNTCLAFE